MAGKPVTTRLVCLHKLIASPYAFARMSFASKGITHIFKIMYVILKQKVGS